MKFSIIIPYYNSHDYIKTAIDSLYVQWNEDFEIIIIDDVSDDSSYLQLQEIVSKYTMPIHIYRQVVNGGPGKARKDGLKRAKGEYVLFLDSDDSFEPTTMETLLKILSDNVDVALFDCYRVTEARKIKLNTLNNLIIGASKSDYIAFSYDSLWCMCIKRDLLQAFEFPEIYNAEDTVSVPLILSKAKNITHTQEALYNYYYRTNSLSTKASSRLVNGFVQAWDYLKNNINEEYLEAFQFRLVKLVVYGVTLNWIRAGLPSKELKEKLNSFDLENNNWKSNKYISTLPLRKRIFLVLVRRRAFFLLKAYVKLQNYLIKI